MRGSLFILVVSCCLLHAGEADPTIQRIAEAAQGLIHAQREDGSWPEPRAHELGLTWLPPPPEAGRESNQPLPEHRYRSAAPSLGFAAEALWRSRAWVPEASAAAARAHLLAAKALLADPHRPVTLDESVSFLLADTARGVPDANPIVTATEQACRLRLDQGIRHGSTGDTFLGLINPESPRHIDLMRTFVASDLLPPLRREWLGDAGTKVARFQPLFPSVVTNATPFPLVHEASQAASALSAFGRQQRQRPYCERH